MSARPTRRMPLTGGPSPIESLEMQQFGRRVHDLRVARGMSQSDLARAIWGTTKDKNGYDVARNRDRISQYEMGRSIPEPQNLKALAEALGTSVEDLAPGVVMSTIDREAPAIQITAVAGHMDRVHVVLNKLVPLTVAAKIIAIVSEDEAANGE